MSFVEDKNQAIELAKALIQNNHVIPYSGRDGICFLLKDGDTFYSFSDIVNFFLENIQNMNRWT